MENIAKLQDFVCEYFDKELAKFYSFSMWKDLVCLLREARQNPNAIKHFDRYGEAFRVRMVVADVLASEDKWAPCLNVVYGWKIGKSIVPVSLMIVKDKVSYAQIGDMMNVLKTYGDHFDFVKEFEKSVVLIAALKG